MSNRNWIRFGWFVSGACTFSGIGGILSDHPWLGLFNLFLGVSNGLLTKYREGL